MTTTRSSSRRPTAELRELASLAAVEPIGQMRRPTAAHADVRRIACVAAVLDVHTLDRHLRAARRLDDHLRAVIEVVAAARRTARPRIAGPADRTARARQLDQAIGIVRVTAEPREQGQKLIQIDWTPPTPEAFGFGTYPYGVPLQLVTSGQPNESARRFLDFVRSAEGRQLLGRNLTFVP